MQPGPELAERLLSRPVKEWKSLVKGDWFTPRDTTEWCQSQWNTWKKDDDLRSFMEFDRHTWLVDESLRLADGTTMGSGVEGRIPFLDPRVIAAAHAVPASWSVSRTKTKALLKETYRHILPEHLFTLPKASFYPPLAKWLRREASPLIDEALAHPRIKELFDVDALRHVANDHIEKKRYGLHVLHGVIQLSHWFTAVYDA
jgi:asparagine synthase (glutamine-hydrolysing)